MKLYPNDTSWNHKFNRPQAEVLATKLAWGIPMVARELVLGKIVMISTFLFITLSL